MSKTQYYDAAVIRTRQGYEKKKGTFEEAQRVCESEPERLQLDLYTFVIFVQTL